MKHVRVPQTILQSLIEHARREAPNECCGVLGGKDNRLDTAYPIHNDQSSPTRYFGSPQDLFAAVKMMRQKEEEITGIYHSHPTGPAYPSTTDLAENGYPGLYYFIISLLNPEPDVQCFHLLEDGKVVTLEIISE